MFVSNIKYVWKRNTIVKVEDITKKVGVHVGNGFRFFKVTPLMVGLRYGELALTRKYVKKWEVGWRCSTGMSKVKLVVKKGEGLSNKKK